MLEVDDQLTFGFCRELMACVLQSEEMQLKFGEENDPFKEQPGELGKELLAEKSEHE